MSLAAWTAAALAAALTVQGSGDCPSPGQVSASLSGVLATSADGEADAAFVTPDGPDLVITVRGPDGSLRLTRRIARGDGSPRACAALAAAAAVVIATWNIERSTELLLLPAVSRPPPPPALPAVLERIRENPAAAAAPAFFTIGAAIGTSAGSAGFTDTAQIQVAARPGGWPAGLAATLTADGEREQALAGGIAAWRRMTAGAGPWLALGHRPVDVEAGAQLFLGWTGVRGSGFDVNRTDHRLSPGLDGVLRLAAARSIQPFFEAAVRFWFAPQELAVLDTGPAGGSAGLPRLEGRFSVGMRFQLAR